MHIAWVNLIDKAGNLTGLGYPRTRNSGRGKRVSAGRNFNDGMLFFLIGVYMLLSTLTDLYSKKLHF